MPTAHHGAMDQDGTGGAAVKQDDSIPAVLRRRYKLFREEGYNEDCCRVLERAAEAIERLQRKPDEAAEEALGIWMEVAASNDRACLEAFERWWPTAWKPPLPTKATSPMASFEAGWNARSADKPFARQSTVDRLDRVRARAHSLSAITCAGCTEWTHPLCWIASELEGVFAEMRALKAPRAQALDQMVQASEEIGGYDLPAQKTGASLESIAASEKCEHGVPRRFCTALHAPTLLTCVECDQPAAPGSLMCELHRAIPRNEP